MSHVITHGLGGSASELLGLGLLPGEPAAGASAAEIWNYVLGNGMTAGATLVQLHAYVSDLYRVHGLLLGTPLVVTPTTRVAGPVDQTIDTVGDTVTVTRQ